MTYFWTHMLALYLDGPEFLLQEKDDSRLRARWVGYEIWNIPRCRKDWRISCTVLARGEIVPFYGAYAELPGKAKIKHKLLRNVPTPGLERL